MSPKVYVGAMSPTGGTAKVASLLAQGFRACGQSLSEFSFLTPAQRALPPQFSPDDIAIFCFPVFAGRVPKCLTAWPQLQGHGAKAVVGAVYGNRACDDATREMAAILHDHGFKVIASAELIAQHSLIPQLAAGRPDAEDANWLHHFAAQIMQVVAQDVAEIAIDRSPYLPYGPTPYPVLLDPARCKQCKVCSRFCPQQLIGVGGVADGERLKAECLNCQACVARCPYHNRALPNQVQTMMAPMLKQIWRNNQARKENRACFGEA